MKKFIAYTVIILLMLGGGLWYEYIYPPSIYTRISQHLLNSIDDAFASQNRSLIGETLGAALDDSAQVVLEIGFPPMPGQTVKNVQAEQFNKTDFLRFVDNMLYTLHDYKVTAIATSIVLSPDKRSGTLSLSAEEQADGLEMDANMHFTGETVCSADMLFSTPSHTQIKKLFCVTQLHFGAPQAAKHPGQ